MPGIQFKGKGAVMDAYRFNKVGPWAICCGKEMPFSCEEEDPEVASGFLEDCLDKLREGHSEAEYSLRVFRQVPPHGIVSNTPYTNSFRFRLYNDEEYEGRHPFANSVNMLITRLDALERRLDEPAEVEEAGPPSFGDTMAGLINKPEVQQFLLGKIFGLVNQIFPNQKSAPAAMSGVTPMDTQTAYVKTSADLFNALDPEERQKFDQAVYVLLGDPHIGTNLLKLAAIFQGDPDKYRWLCKMA